MGKLPEAMEYPDVVEEVVLSEIRPKMALFLVDKFDKEYVDANKLVNEFFKVYLRR